LQSLPYDWALLTRNCREDKLTEIIATENFPLTKTAGCPFDPSPTLTAMQAEQPITRVRLWDGSHPWLITRHADQRALLADPRVSSDCLRPGYPFGSASMRVRRQNSISFSALDDPEHARLRRMVVPSFTVKRMNMLRPAVQKIVDDLIDQLLAGPKPADLVSDFALPVPSLVICELLGVPYEDHDFFQRRSRTGVKPGSATEEVTGAHNELVEYLDRLVGVKMENPGDDLLSALAAQRVRTGELTRNELARMGVMLLVAGHETTANMIALGTAALLEHPGQLAELRGTDDPDVVRGAVEELLRYLTIAHFGRRRVAAADIEINGLWIREGDGIIFPNEVANRDPDVFAEPDRLDLHRDARRHLAFGSGVHQCVGQPLARMELQVVYGTLYRRIPSLRLAVPITDVPFKYDAAIYGVYELPVTW
jgi:cytochrome P450